MIKIAWCKASAGILALGFGIGMGWADTAKPAMEMTAGWLVDPKTVEMDYILDFGTGMFPEHYDIFTNVKDRSVKDGKLHLVLGNEKDAQLAVPNPSMLASGKYREVEVRFRLKANEPQEALKSGLKLEWENATGEKDSITVPIRDAKGREFQSCVIPLSDNKKWLEGRKNRIGIPLTFGQVNPKGSEVDVDYVRFRLTKEKEVDNKVYQTSLRMFYLENVVDGFRKQGLEVKGLKGEIAEFKEAAKKATGNRSRYVAEKKPEDLEAAYQEVTRAEEILKGFYPHIETARRLVDLKDEVEAVGKVSGLYGRLGVEVKGVSAESMMRPYEKLAGKVKEGDFDINKAIDGLNEKVKSNWVKLDAVLPMGFPIRLGLSQTSFGRFGWSPAAFNEGLLVYNVKDNVLRKEHGKFDFSFRPGEAKLISQEKTDVNWVSFRKASVYRDDSGKDIKWNLICSLLAPGVLLDTDSPVVQFQGRQYAPDKALFKDKTGYKVMPLKKGKIEMDLAENWVMLLWNDPDREQEFSPVVLVLGKKPGTVEKDNKYLTIRNSSGVGHVGIVDYEGVMPFNLEEIGKWEQAVPREVVEKCQGLARVMLNVPIRCEEYFGIDEQKREVLIRDEFEYLTVTNEWGLAGVEYAPLAPIMSFAKDLGYPVKPQQELLDFGIPTKYGPYRCAKGNVLQYTIPFPDYNHRCYLNTHTMDDLVPALFRKSAVKGAEPLSQLNHLARPSSADFLLGLSTSAGEMAPACNLLPEGAQPVEIDLSELGRWQDMYFNRLKTCFGTLDNACFIGKMWPFLDRVEPFTGKYYIQSGSLWFRVGDPKVDSCMMTGHGFEGLGDTINLHGYQLRKLYLYAKYSGNWDFIREHWDMIVKLFADAQRMNDWANCALPYQEDEADTHIDMGPDCLKNPVSMIYLARGLDNAEYYRWAGYIASKTAVALLVQFDMGAYFKKYHGDPLPEGISWECGLSEFGLPVSTKTWSANQPLWLDEKFRKQNKDLRPGVNRSLLSNIYSGCGYMTEILDMRGQFLTAPFEKFVYGTYPAYFKDWYIPFRNQGDQQFMTRLFLDQDTAILSKEFKQYILPQIPTHLRNYDQSSGMILPIIAQLQGRDAPCYLVDWEPNRILKGEYSFADNRAEIGIEARTKGIIRLKSMIQPAAIRDNGGLVSAPNWEYDPVRKLLIIRIDQGQHALVLDYTGWTKPQWKKIAIDPEPIRQEMAREKQIRETCLQQMNLYKTTNLCVTLDISRQANMGFADEKADDQKGGLFDEGRSLTNLPAGQGKFAGIPFMIIDPAQNNGRSCMVLKGQAKPFFQEKAEGIEVKRKFKNLYVLHNACYCASDGAVVYRIRLNYGDGSRGEIEVKAGDMIRDWFFNPDKINDLSEAKVGWQGKAMKNSAGVTEEINVALYCAKLANPNPGKEVQTIDIISNNAKAVPAIFGMTVEE